MRRGLAGALVAAAAMLAVPATVLAVDQRAGSYLPVQGPSLAGESLLWSEQQLNGAYLLRRRAPEQVSLVRPSPTPRFDYESFVPEFAASPKRVIVNEGRLFEGVGKPVGNLYSSAGILTGALGEPLSALTGDCRDNAGRSVDVSGDVVAYRDDCSKRLVVRDLGPSPAFPPATFPTGVDIPIEVRVAGSLVADNADGTVTVRDARTRAEVYSVRAPSNGLSPDQPDVRSLDIQADGTTVFEYLVVEGSQLRSRFGWASPAEPRLHPLPIGAPALSGASLALAKNRYAFARRRRYQSERSEVLVGDLNGRISRVSDNSVGGVDFDGARVTWVDADCRGPLVRVRQLGDPAVRGGRRNCRLQLRGKRVTRRGALRMALSCKGFVRRCEAVDVVVRTARRYRLGRRWVRSGAVIAKGSRDFTSYRPHIGLSTRGRRLLRRHGRLRVKIGADLISAYVPMERRRATTTLRRPRGLRP